MLPPNVKTLLKASAHLIRQKVSATSLGNILASNNTLRISNNRQSDELSPTAAAAVETVLRGK